MPGDGAFCAACGHGFFVGADAYIGPLHPVCKAVS